MRGDEDGLVLSSEIQKNALNRIQIKAYFGVFRKFQCTAHIYLPKT